MTFVIAKRGGSSLDWHLWRQGTRLLTFETRDEAIIGLGELAGTFGFDSLMLLEQVGITFNVDVE